MAVKVHTISSYNEDGANEFSSGELVGISQLCCFCSESYLMFVDSGELGAHVSEYAQVAFAGQSAEFREQVITGSHPDCWSEFFDDWDEE